MSIVLHSPFTLAECQQRLKNETVPKPPWWHESMRIGYEKFHRLEDAPVIGIFNDERFDLHIKEYWSGPIVWHGRLEMDTDHGGTRVTIVQLQPGDIVRIVLFAAIFIMMVMFLPDKPPIHRTAEEGPQSYFWGVLAAPLIFGSALVLIVVLNIRIYKRASKALKVFLMRVLEASDY